MHSAAGNIIGGVIHGSDHKKNGNNEGGKEKLRRHSLRDGLRDSLGGKAKGKPKKKMSNNWGSLKKAAKQEGAKIVPKGEEGIDNKLHKIESITSLVEIATSKKGVSKRRMRHLLQKQEIEDLLYNVEIGNETTKENGQSKIEKDTVFGPLTIDTYIVCRLIPLVCKYKEEAPKVNRIFTALELISFSFTSFGALLAVLNLAEWVAITVAIAGALQSAVARSGLRARRDQLNVNISILHNLLTWWDSLTIVERRTLAAREKIVLTTEDCVLSLAEEQTGRKRNEGVSNIVKDTKRDAGAGGTAVEGAATAGAPENRQGADGGDGGLGGEHNE
jgi:hypothetical protein